MSKLRKSGVGFLYTFHQKTNPRNLETNPGITREKRKRTQELGERTQGSRFDGRKCVVRSFAHNRVRAFRTRLLVKRKALEGGRIGQNRVFPKRFGPVTIWGLIPNSQSCDET